jgi:hypothetical protein
MTTATRYRLGDFVTVKANAIGAPHDMEGEVIAVWPRKYTVEFFVPSINTHKCWDLRHSQLTPAPITGTQLVDAIHAMKDE